MFFPILVGAPSCSGDVLIGASEMYMEIVGNYLYFTISSTNQFKIYDISNICSPVLKSTTTTTTGDASLTTPRAIKVTSDGTSAFITHQTNPLKVSSWNVTTKTAPTFRTYVNAPDSGGLVGIPKDAYLLNDVTFYFICVDIQAGASNRPLLKCNVTNPDSLGTPAAAMTAGAGIRADGMQLIYNGTYLLVNTLIAVSGIESVATLYIITLDDNVSLLVGDELLNTKGLD